MSGQHPFDADTAVTLVDGDVPPVHPVATFATTVSDRWGLMRAGGFANGGYVLATCLRAAAARMPHPDPIAVSATYLSRVRFGPALIDVETLREGRRMSSAEIRLRQDKERVRVVATFGDLASADGTTDLRNRAPELPPPDECVAVQSEVMPGFTLGQRVQYRYRDLPGWLSGEPSGDLTAEFWMRLAPGPDGSLRDADPIALAGLVDMATPPVIDLGETGSTTIELSVHVRGRPAPGWLACRVATRHVIAGYHEEDFEIWDGSGSLVAQSRQLAVLPSRRVAR
jgi:acyl-CoA thioesterase